MNHRILAALIASLVAGVLLFVFNLWIPVVVLVVTGLFLIGAVQHLSYEQRNLERLQYHASHEHGLDQIRDLSLLEELNARF